MCLSNDVQVLLHRQKTFVDGRDEAGLAGCYWPEMVLETRFNAGEAVVAEGRDDVIGQITTGWADASRPAMVHFVGPAAVREETADRVHAHSMCLYLSAADGSVLGWGAYHDVLERRGGDLRLLTRRVDGTLLPRPAAAGG